MSGMMCTPGERDLAHAADQALAKARAAGLAGEALVEAAVEAVAGVWAHIDRAAIRAAVLRQLAPDAAPGSG
jgi:hypothetical protein